MKWRLKVIRKIFFTKNTFYCFVVIAILFCRILAAERDIIKLRRIPFVYSPVIENRTFKFKIAFVFDYCPEEHWVYYDDKNKLIVIEFFGVHIEPPEDLTIRGTSIVSNLKIFNYDTKLSLSGKASKITMSMNEGWLHAESEIIGDRILQINMWMPLNPSKILEGKRNHYIIPFVVSVSAILITSFVLLLLMQKK